jgi:hypothetical protein
MRPLKRLVLSPICTVLAVFLGFIYGTLFLLFTTFPEVFEQTYGFGLGVGLFSGLVWFNLASDKAMQRKRAASADGQLKPEARLAPVQWGVFFVPVGPNLRLDGGVSRALDCVHYRDGPSLSWG